MSKPHLAPRLPRVPFVRPVSVRFEGDANFQWLLASNVSEGGLFLRMAEPPKNGTKLTLQLEARGKTLPFAEAEIVWVRPIDVSRVEGLPGCGLRFTNMAGDAMALVKHLVDAGGTSRGQGKTIPFGLEQAPKIHQGALTPGEVIHQHLGPTSHAMPLVKLATDVAIGAQLPVHQFGSAPAAASEPIALVQALPGVPEGKRITAPEPVVRVTPPRGQAAAPSVVVAPDLAAEASFVPKLEGALETAAPAGVPEKGALDLEQELAFFQTSGPHPGAKPITASAFEGVKKAALVVDFSRDELKVASVQQEPRFDSLGLGAVPKHEVTDPELAAQFAALRGHSKLGNGLGLAAMAIGVCAALFFGWKGLAAGLRNEMAPAPVAAATSADAAPAALAAADDADAEPELETEVAPVAASKPEPMKAAPAPVAVAKAEPVKAVAAPAPVIAPKVEAPKAQALAVPAAPRAVPVAAPRPAASAAPAFHTVALPMGAAKSLSIAVDGSNLLLEVGLEKGGKVAKAFALSNPSRIVLDLDGATVKGSPHASGFGPVTGIRLGARAGGTRLVLDLARATREPTIEGHRIKVPLD